MATGSGVFKKVNGLWGFRFSLLIDGKRVSRLKSTDANGKTLGSKSAAIKAREAAIAAAYIEAKQNIKITRRTFKDVYKEYCEKGRTEKAYQTIRKQDSLWENHLCERFGNKYVNDISVAEINDYLAELYYIDHYSYKYVESFLKMFYLILGQAYSRNYLEVDTYNKLCMNKNTKISMPKLKAEDNTDIIYFDRGELLLLDEYFKGTNAETAYLLGRYCGLRINECFGLKWENVDLENGTIRIDRQMQYQDKIIKLVAPKTRNAIRTLYLNDTLKEHLSIKAAKWKSDAIEYKELQQQNQRFVQDIDGTLISSTELVNSLSDGRIQTVNSFKYPTREIKSKLNIDFKYHYLRHTYGTRMAEMNTPQHLLCNQMGHGNIHVTQQYYLAVSKDGLDILRDNINQL